MLSEHSPTYEYIPVENICYNPVEKFCYNTVSNLRIINRWNKESMQQLFSYNIPEGCSSQNFSYMVLDPGILELSGKCRDSNNNQGNYPKPVKMHPVIYRKNTIYLHHLLESPGIAALTSKN